MNVNGFQLLKIRTNNNTFIKEIEELEIKTDIKLPLFYKKLIGYFDLSELKRESYYYKEDKWTFTSYIYKPNEKIDIINFADVKQSLENYRFNEEDVISEGLLNLASIGRYSGGLFVGTKVKFYDKIVLDSNEDGEKRFKVISDNIFDFIKDLESFIIEKEYRPYNIDLSMLYKNFGENFWRVRET